MSQTRLHYKSIPLKANITFPKLLIITITLLVTFVIPAQVITIQKQNISTSTFANSQSSNSVSASNTFVPTTSTPQVAGASVAVESGNIGIQNGYQVPLLGVTLQRNSAPFMFLGGFFIFASLIILVYMSRVTPNKAYRPVDRY